MDRSSIILGIDWLKAYGKVTFDYNDNSVSFTKDEKHTILKGIFEGTKLGETAAKLKSILVAQWYQAGLEGNCCAIGQYVPTKAAAEKEELPILIQDVLNR